MKSDKIFLPVLFALVMLLFVFFIVWYLPAANERAFMLEDVSKSIETSLGRERKQQYEYDETVAAIPELQEKLDRLIPVNNELSDQVDSLKAERKLLRQEKKDLESSLDSTGEQEVTGNE